MPLNLTITAPGETTLEIKKSRFICYVARITDESDAKQIINEVRLAHPKANHHCFAYVLGDQDQIQRESDAGEPSGTAGVPILEVLKRKRVHNVISVVTRYFGGVKLGVGGLIRAYSNATSQTIDSVGLVNLVTQTRLALSIPYSSYDQLVYDLNEAHVLIEETSYATDVTVHVSVDRQSVEQFKQQIRNRFNNQVTFVEGTDHFAEVPYKLN
ncbi:YigZ family protein [Levilactobacillus bambusae]|uniref:YigZ family protein n=1 Tax=Levilactobacillus bambusae TaxID=2024736 RepID=A0A2V1MWC7_9LACO|nr:YigZ family protein [Levilactobacillus bambusae]PWF99413.1 YigZ family protein [Levilactobacillus bambusae]